MPPLIALAKDKDLGVRRAVLLALTRFGPAAEKALPLFRAALRDKEGENRLVGVLGIGKLGPRGREAVPDLIAGLSDKDRFIRAEHRALVLTDADPDRLIDSLSRFVFPTLEKWLDRDET